jgi:hypothetical protein
MGYWRLPLYLTSCIFCFDLVNLESYSHSFLGGPITKIGRSVDDLPSTRRQAESGPTTQASSSRYNVRRAIQAGRGHGNFSQSWTRYVENFRTAYSARVESFCFDTILDHGLKNIQRSTHAETKQKASSLTILIDPASSISITHFNNSKAQNAVRLAGPYSALLQQAAASRKKSSKTPTSRNRKRPSMSEEDYVRATTYGDEHDTMPIRSGTSRRCIICMKKIRFECTHEDCQARVRSFSSGQELYGTPLCPASAGPRTDTDLYGTNNNKTCLELHFLKACTSNAGYKGKEDEGSE